ncbi:hypothetical protein J27TS8_05170 [Robertmurraya siralis]|uniref:Uncharacterized protein n=1 Tax=Robertmurraya siralis TaxID=77777 RepID=A0A919WEZ7_9BACI|nr:hypothetical protein [Robertmurraya siralis]PAE21971.1 hypothetical protein CHH80_03495 [Bacillus sp. 7504-2]GIN60524.1 hypothetical protein J27TS8_05170 [Robertmurraya siralis]
MTNYQNIDWEHIKKQGSQIIMIDVDHPNMIKVVENDLVSEREELLTVDKYITHQSNPYGPTGLVNVYEIVERAVDNRNNLILFVRNNTIKYER